MAENAHLSRKGHDESEVDASKSSSAGQKMATLSLADLQTRLNWSADGLSHEEAQSRLARYGPNELPEEKINPFLKFLSYFWGPIPWMIEAAAILSAFVRHWADFVIITILLVANAIVGFWEEYQAGSAVAALRETLALQARARRAGVWTTISARELVPGDTIRLRIGDIVPADARLLPGDPVQVDQSSLTGESLPVLRETGDAVYSGSILKQGEVDALVYATGKETYFGKAAGLVETAQTVGHFRRAVLKIGDYLIVLAIGLVVLILAVALFRGDNMFTSMQFALVLTVAAIPVAMPTVLSITMALGARVLVQKQAIVTRLSSIEELAGVDLLCVDKTGTLTLNSLTLGDSFTLPGVPSEQVVLCAALASRAEDQDPIDLAVLGALDDTCPQDSYRVLHFEPFDPVHKRTEAEVQGPDGAVFSVAKGAPQVILQLAADAPRVHSQVESAVNEFATRGFRSLGVARTDAEGQWQFLGVLPLYDPPREDSMDTIETARQMGVKVKMVTGDQTAIAREIASQVGLGTNIVEASAFEEAAYHEEAQLADTIEKADGFAEVFPEHKYHIVDVLQQRGHIVGMTGDGVNDAPALKKADAGIAVSGATDAARSAADLVLLAPGLCVITDAIGESRKIFERMTSYAIYRIAETIRVLLFMTLSILAFNFYPVTAVMIVLLALLNDGAILSIAYDRVRSSNEPRAWNMQEVLGIATALGVVGVVASFGLFYMAETVFHLSPEAIQSLMYLKLSVSGHLTIFLTRTRGPFWCSRPATVLIAAVVATQAVATLIAVYGVFMAPIGWPWALLVWGYALLWFMINDRVKLAAYRIFGSRGESLLAGWCTR
jgi:H+-transporting ATPase